MVVYPELVSSGASQAMLALCGAALVQPLFSRRLGTNWWLIAFGTLGQLGLDLFVSSAHTIKAGHVAGLLIGFAAASFSNRNRGQES